MRKLAVAPHTVFTFSFPVHTDLGIGGDARKKIVDEGGQGIISTQAMI
jgi:hypothetical protein